MINQSVEYENDQIIDGLYDKSQKRRGARALCYYVKGSWHEACSLSIHKAAKGGMLATLGGNKSDEESNWLFYLVNMIAKDKCST